MTVSQKGGLRQRAAACAHESPSCGAAVQVKAALGGAVQQSVLSAPGAMLSCPHPLSLQTESETLLAASAAVVVVAAAPLWGFSTASGTKSRLPIYRRRVADEKDEKMATNRQSSSTPR